MEQENNVTSLRDHSIEVDNASLHLIIVNKKKTRLFEASLRDILHNHNYTEIFACTEGTISIRIEDEKITLGKGDVCIVPAELNHTLVYKEIVNEREWAAIGISLNKKQKQATRDFYGRFSKLLIDTPLRVYRSALDIANEIIDLYYTVYPEGSLTPVYKLGLLLERLEELECEMHGAAVHKTKVSNVELEMDISRLTLIEEIINSRYLEDLKSEQIAELVFVSRRQLDRIIMRRYGMSLRQVLNEKRLKYAMKQLHDSRRTAEEIAEKAGFNSKSAFYRAFFDAYGMTPTEYRKTIQLISK